MVLIRAVTDAEAARRLDEAERGLLKRRPDLSAAAGTWPWQKRVLTGAGIALVSSALLAPEPALGAIYAMLALPFLFVVTLRATALWHLTVARRTPAIREAPRQSDEDLPTYTVLVPLYREAGVVRDLLSALAALDYPIQKLEILLIVESDDRETRVALWSAGLAANMRIVTVPDGAPRTKPRALNYALQFARGSYVVVYDAEDLPEPDQLRLALAVLQRAPDRIGCVQARLNIYNAGQSWLTRQFTIEYTALFDALLPALHRLELPVPLGGTSNHLPRKVLEEVGGWDPFNVTEDADLGIRLARAGWQVAVLASTTWEEAPAGFSGWLGQRTRWLKGWIQTFLVHMREPRRLLRELGPKRFIGLQILMGGLILSALVHPWFYVVVAVDLWQGRLLEPPHTSLGRALWWLGAFNLTAGYVSAMALGAAAVAMRGQLRLAAHGLWMPVYWLAISFAATALWRSS